MTCTPVIMEDIPCELIINWDHIILHYGTRSKKLSSNVVCPFNGYRYRHAMAMGTCVFRLQVRTCYSYVYGFDKTVHLGIAGLSIRT